MRGFDSNQFGLDDIADLLGDVLNRHGNDLSDRQREELWDRRNRIEEARRYNDPSRAFSGEQGKEGFMDDILRIAGPVVAGYLIRMAQDRLMGRGGEQEARLDADDLDRARRGRGPEYGTYREDDVIHRSSRGGQSVEEVD